MGKHERGNVESAEKMIVKLLNGQSIDRAHSEYKRIINVYNYIIKKYPNIKYAEHIGNNYDTIGDILIKIKKIRLFLTTTEEIYIELKFLNGGKGTLANISQDALTIYKIFEGTSWSKYRKNEDHRNNIEKILNEYNYPENLNFEEKGAYIKKNENETTKNIKERIVKYDREVKKKYIKYLETLDYDKENLKKFVLLLLFGRHTKKLIQDGMKKNINKIINKNVKYEIYYIYKSEIKEKEYSEIKKILDENLEIEYKENETNIIIRTNKTKTNILRIVFHWKNAFQGIKTPCLNIFEI